MTIQVCFCKKRTKKTRTMQKQHTKRTENKNKCDKFLLLCELSVDFMRAYMVIYNIIAWLNTEAIICDEIGRIHVRPKQLFRGMSATQA